MNRLDDGIHCFDRLRGLHLTTSRPFTVGNLLLVGYNHAVKQSVWQ